MAVDMKYINDDDEFEDIDFVDEEEVLEDTSDDFNNFNGPDNDESNSDDEEEYSSVTWAAKTNDFSYYQDFMNNFNTDDDEFEDNEDENEEEHHIVDADDEAPSERKKIKTLFPNLKKEAAAEKHKEQQFEEFMQSEDMIQQENTEFEFEGEPSDEFVEACEETVKVIDNTKIICKQIGDESLRSLFGKIDADNRTAAKNVPNTANNIIGTESDGTPVLRKYKNKAVMEKVTFAKPVESEKTVKQRLIPYAMFVLGVSGFFGVKANSYYDYKSQFVPDLKPTDCILGWIAQENIQTTLIPFYANVFFPVFGIMLLVTAVIAWFFWSKNEERLKARVGHEHGNARFGTPKDFKTFKTKFMEQ